MDKLVKEYQTFFLVRMDGEALQSFRLPPSLEPAVNPQLFYKICFVFLLPYDDIFATSEARLPATLRKQLYRQGAHIHINEVDLNDPHNALPKNCVLVN